MKLWLKVVISVIIISFSGFLVDLYSLFGAQFTGGMAGDQFNATSSSYTATQIGMSMWGHTGLVSIISAIIVIALLKLVWFRNKQVTDIIK